ncbi:ABC transporter permease [Halorarius halobius]|uniref:ABC transporter permease n=1 Tax=Halorarius halobius TaxID=2962671 RepID=UPI0020CDF3DE|nr:ABC transporter permease subunit [Halorarius halobius]
MTSPVVALARKDLADAARSKLMWGLTAVLLVVTVPSFAGTVGSSFISGPADAVEWLPGVFQNFVAPVAMIAAYRSVVGERESGSIRTLFGHPVTRGEFIAGKLLGRVALVGVVLAVGMLALGGVVVATYGTLPVALFVAVTAYVVAYGAVWTAITVGVSAAVSSRLQAIAVMLGLFLFFGPFTLWQTFGLGAAALVATGRPSTAAIDPIDPATWPDWYLYAQRLNPMRNFEMTREFAASLGDPTIGYFGAVEVQVFGLAALVAWAAVPLAAGYWRFERADLG